MGRAWLAGCLTLLLAAAGCGGDEEGGSGFTPTFDLEVLAEGSGEANSEHLHSYAVGTRATFDNDEIANSDPRHYVVEKNTTWAGWSATRVAWLNGQAEYWHDDEVGLTYLGGTHPGPRKLAKTYVLHEVRVGKRWRSGGSEFEVIGRVNEVTPFGDAVVWSIEERPSTGDFTVRRYAEGFGQIESGYDGPGSYVLKSMWRPLEPLNAGMEGPRDAVQKLSGALLGEDGLPAHLPFEPIAAGPVQPLEHDPSVYVVLAEAIQWAVEEPNGTVSFSMEGEGWTHDAGPLYVGEVGRDINLQRRLPECMRVPVENPTRIYDNPESLGFTFDADPKEHPGQMQTGGAKCNGHLLGTDPFVEPDGATYWMGGEPLGQVGYVHRVTNMIIGNESGGRPRRLRGKEGGYGLWKWGTPHNKEDEELLSEIADSGQMLHAMNHLAYGVWRATLTPERLNGEPFPVFDIGRTGAITRTVMDFDAGTMTVPELVSYVGFNGTVQSSPGERKYIVAYDDSVDRVRVDADGELRVERILNLELPEGERLVGALQQGSSDVIVMTSHRTDNRLPGDGGECQVFCDPDLRRTYLWRMPATPMEYTPPAVFAVSGRMSGFDAVVCWPAGDEELETDGWTLGGVPAAAVDRLDEVDSCALIVRDLDAAGTHNLVEGPVPGVGRMRIVLDPAESEASFGPQPGGTNGILAAGVPMADGSTLVGGGGDVMGGRTWYSPEWLPSRPRARSVVDAATAVQTHPEGSNIVFAQSDTGRGIWAYAESRTLANSVTDYVLGYVAQRGGVTRAEITFPMLPTIVGRIQGGGVMVEGGGVYAYLYPDGSFEQPIDDAAYGRPEVIFADGTECRTWWDNTTSFQGVRCHDGSGNVLGDAPGLSGPYWPTKDGRLVAYEGGLSAQNLRLLDPTTATTSDISLNEPGALQLVYGYDGDLYVFFRAEGTTASSRGIWRLRNNTLEALDLPDLESGDFWDVEAGFPDGIDSVAVTRDYLLVVARNGRFFRVPVSALD